MITAYSATPVKMEKMSFDKIGSGSGAMRYAFGLYSGEMQTAKHYLDQYHGTKLAEKSYHIRDSSLEATPGTISYKVCEKLCEANQNYLAVRDSFAGDEAALAAIDYIEQAGGVSEVFGAIYKLKIPDHNIEDVKCWDDTMELDLINETTLKYHLTKPDTVRNLVAAAEALNVNIGDSLDDVGYILDRIYEEGFDYGSEEGDLSFSADINEYKEVWDAMIRGDTYTDFDCHADFYDDYPQQYVDAVKVALGNDFPCLEVESSYESVYSMIAASLAPNEHDQSKNIQGKKLASAFFSNELGIEMLLADTMYGREGAKELIILSEKLASTVKLEIEDPYGDVTYGFESDLDKLNVKFNGVDTDNEHEYGRTYSLR